MNKKFNFLKSEGYSIIDSNSSRKGGNGQVLFVKKNTKKYALKFIEFNKNLKKFLRTNREIDILKREHNIEGIIPIIDSKIIEGKYAWYTMPISDPINIKNFSKRHIKKIITDLKYVAETLKKLHEKNIFHRDIKPQNLLYLNNKLCLGDFGLVSYPEALEITKETDRIGPWTTIPPEHKRNAKSADNEKGDVYSFAKTMWILITGEENSFDGQYSYKDSSIRLLTYRDKIDNENYYESAPLAILDDILIQATENQPEKRPSIDSIINSLDLFIDSDYSQKVNYEWKFITHNLFPYGVPTTSFWTNPVDIVNILKEMTYFKQTNHLFFNSGGLDLTDVYLSNEENYIELDCDTLIHKLKVKSLRFETFSIPSWNYFLLELDPLNEIYVSNEKIITTDEVYPLEVIELTPGKYIPDWCHNYNRDMTTTGYPTFPKTARRISLCLSGQLILCSKSGMYNAETSTYNGYQKYFSAEDFRKFIDYCLITNGLLFKVTQTIELSDCTQDEKKVFLNALISGKHIDPFKPKVTKIPYSNEDEKLEIELINNFLNKLNLNKKIDLSSSIHYEVTFNFNKNRIEYKILSDGKLKVKKRSIIFAPDSIDLSEVFEEQKKFNKKSVTEIYKNFCNVCNDLNISKNQVKFHINDIIINDISKMSLATIEELDNILKGGDSFISNTLVVDLNGDIKLIPKNKNTFEISLYPIQIDQFPAYDNSVGEFYNDRSFVLKQIYNSYLNYYYQLIKTKRRVISVDCCESSDIILEKIQNLNFDK